MQDDGVDIWGDGSTYKGNDIERFYRYGLLVNPNLRIYKPWLDEQFVGELGGRDEMSEFLTTRDLPYRDVEGEGVLHRRQHLGGDARGQVARGAVHARWTSSSRSWASPTATSRCAIAAEVVRIRFHEGWPVALNGQTFDTQVDAGPRGQRDRRAPRAWA